MPCAHDTQRAQIAKGEERVDSKPRDEETMSDEEVKGVLSRRGNDEKVDRQILNHAIRGAVNCISTWKRLLTP